MQETSNQKGAVPLAKSHLVWDGGKRSANPSQSAGGWMTGQALVIVGRGRRLRAKSSRGGSEMFVMLLQTESNPCRQAYDMDDLRAFLEDVGVGCCIPPKANRVNPAPYDKQEYKKRHRVENAFQRLRKPGLSHPTSHLAMAGDD